jgi:hypothetical protein
MGFSYLSPDEQLTTDQSMLDDCKRFFERYYALIKIARSGLHTRHVPQLMPEILPLSSISIL